MPSDIPEQVTAKAALYGEAEDAVSKLYAAADLLVALELKSLKGRAYEDERESIADRMMFNWAKGQAELRAFASQQLAGYSRLHWALSFPEVFGRGGFDAIVGNPPFMGGTKLEPTFGRNLREYLVNILAQGTRGVRGTADLCAYFLARGCSLLREGGGTGLIVTNSIGEGDTLLVGLEKLSTAGIRITRAISSTVWPGSAAVLIALVWVKKGGWSGSHVLNDVEVSSISSSLRVPGAFVARPHP